MRCTGTAMATDRWSKPDRDGEDSPRLEQDAQQAGPLLPRRPRRHVEKVACWPANEASFSPRRGQLGPHGAAQPAIGLLDVPNDLLGTGIDDAVMICRETLWS
jgi:hypothetical protein